MLVDTVIINNRKINISSYTKTVKGKSCTYYRARITVDYDPVTRKQKQKTLNGTTIEAVREQIFQIVNPASVMPKYQGTLIPLKTALPDFIQTRYGGGKAFTLRGKQTQCNLLLQKLGDEYVQTLSRETIQRTVDDLARQYSANTIHGAFSVLRMMMEEYVQKQTIPFNPCLNIRLPIIPMSNGMALSSDQLKDLLLCLSNSPYSHFFNVLAFTATRVGECRALSWDKIDFASHQIVIDQQIPAYTNSVLKYVKNNNPTKLTYSDDVFIFLEAAQKAQQEYMQQAGEHWSNPMNLVFTTPTGDPVPYLTLLTEFKKAADSIGLPDLRMHDLRHTYASLLWEETHRMDLASMILRHKTALTTRKYIHPTSKTYNECRTLMNKVSQHMKDILETPEQEEATSTDDTAPAAKTPLAATTECSSKEVRSIFADFSSDLIERGVSNSVYFIYRSILTNWILPATGNKTFDKVTKSDIEDLVRLMKEKNLSVSFSKTIMTCGKLYFDFAIRMGYATCNPFYQLRW